MCGRFLRLQSWFLGLDVLFGTFHPQSQSHTCTILEEVLVARAEGNWAIALDVDGSNALAGGGMANRKDHLRLRLRQLSYIGSSRWFESYALTV